MPPKRKMDMLEDINKFSNCRYFDIDAKMNKDDYYLAYVLNVKNQKYYVKLSNEGIEEIRKNKGSTIYPMLNPDKERHVLLSVGKSGRGKGLLNSEILKELIRMVKDIKLFYICPTSKEHDLNLNKKEFPNMKQLNPEEFQDMTDDDLSIYFKGSVLVLDDVDKLPKELKKIVVHIQDHILITGRKFNTSLFIMGHLPTDYRNTRLLIDELDYYIGFNDSSLKANRLLGKAYKDMPFDFFDGVKTSIWFFVNFDQHYTITNNNIFFY